MHWKMSFRKWWSFCLSLSVLTIHKIRLSWVTLKSTHLNEISKDMWRTLVHKYEWLIFQSKRQFIFPGCNKLILNSWCHFYETLMSYFTNFAWGNILLDIIAELLICIFFFSYFANCMWEKAYLECFILYGLLLLLLCLYWKMSEF